MGNIFLTSDQHFGHANILTFLDKNKNRIRPHWNNVDEMNEALIENYNSVVQPGDKVYFLGDVAFNPAGMLNVGKLNGDKVLIKGNHDKMKLSVYTKYFRDIRACHNINNLLMTHIPIHIDGSYTYLANVHGHLHQNIMDNEWYVNVCVEQTNFTPIAIEDIEEKVMQFWRKIYGRDVTIKDVNKIRREKRNKGNNFF